MRINKALDEDKTQNSSKKSRRTTREERDLPENFKVSDRWELGRDSAGEYHRAAIDGYVDMLCEASKSDANSANSSAGLTPTHLAALNGQLEALRILVGRGGDPEQTTTNGSSALHLAASRNHLNCVSFLVNFGVNMWALDNELHTAKDVAAIEQKKEVLDYLDQMMAKQSALNTKSVQKLKEKAKVGAEKRLKRLRKAQLKAIKQVERDERYLVKLSNNRRLLKAAHSISDIKLVGRQQVEPNRLSNFPDESSIRYAPSESSLAGSEYCSGSSSSERWLSPSLSSSAMSGHNYFGSQMSVNSQQRIFAGKKIDNLIGARRPSNNCKLDLLDKMRRPQFRLALGFASDKSGKENSKAQLGVAHSKPPANARPKYSDLVALNSGGAQVGEEQTGRSVRLQLLRPNKRQVIASSGESTASSSSVVSKLRGVSRKVQLRRLLQMDTNENGKVNDGVASSEQEPKLGAKTSEIDREVIENGAYEVAKPQTCSIKPTIKLKLNSDSSSCSSSSATAQQNVTGQVDSEAQIGRKKEIKWPPAPSLARAISEPDFGAAFRTSLAADDDDDEDEDEDGDDSEDELPAENDDEQPNDAKQEEQLVRVERKTGDEKGEIRDESQRLLLTQCLSQLKLRHEIRTASSATGHQTNYEQPRSAQVNNNQPGKTGKQLSNHSDELLQLHQLNSSQFPLKPSVIRQHLSGQQSISIATNQGNGSPSDSSTSMFETLVKSETAAGGVPIKAQLKHEIPSQPPSRVDSIGSAGSLADAISSDKSSKSLSSIQSTNSSLTFPELTGISHQSRWPLRSLDQDGAKEMIIADNLADFLRIHNLADLTEALEREQIDLEALMLLSEEDLRSLNILLGPRRKLLKAIEGRRLVEQHEVRANSCLAPIGAKCVMVDTQL